MIILMDIYKTTPCMQMARDPTEAKATVNLHYFIGILIYLIVYILTHHMISLALS